jgi:quinoprotein glucose dehydrogenase
VYVFDRYTGAPVWPIVERSVPQSATPGEKTSATQPMPTKPPAFDRQGVSEDDLIDFTPELHSEAVKLASRYVMGPIFTPAVVSKPEGPLGTLMLPSTTGGANWQGGSVDPETGFFYIFSNTEIGAISMVKEPKRSDMDWVEGSLLAATPGAAGGDGGGGLTVQGLPLVKPPYGRITAINLNQGDIVWQVPHGDTPDAIRNHPALRGLNIPRTGRPGRIGVLTTKTLVIAGDGGFVSTEKGRGAFLRAYDKVTGSEVGAVFMPAPQTGSPMSYAIAGQQYLAIAIGGAGYPSELRVLKVPQR